jgi:hypothetical protein
VFWWVGPDGLSRAGYRPLPKKGTLGLDSTGFARAALRFFRFGFSAPSAGFDSVAAASP